MVELVKIKNVNIRHRLQLISMHLLLGSINLLCVPAGCFFSGLLTGKLLLALNFIHLILFRRFFSSQSQLENDELCN